MTSPRPAGDGAAPPRRAARLPGLLLATAVALVATAVGHALPVLGAPVAGVLLGVLAVTATGYRGRRAVAEVLRPGLVTASRAVLQLAVVLLGARLSFDQVLGVGASSLPVMLGTLAVCLVAARVVGRALGVDADLRTLVGVGTAICGASAIAAVTPVLRPASAKVAYALATVFVFNIAAVLLFPPLGHLLGMSEQAFALFAGTAVNDMSSVVAAATTYGPGAAEDAVVVKLTRTLMIVPVVGVLAARVARRDGAGGVGTRPSAVRLVPWFLVGFVLLAGANSLGLVPDAAHAPLGQVAAFGVTVALSAIGLSTDVSGLRRTGARPLLLGGLLWVVVCVTSLGLQAVLEG